LPKKSQLTHLSKDVWFHASSHHQELLDAVVDGLQVDLAAFRANDADATADVIAKADAKKRDGRKIKNHHLNMLCLAAHCLTFGNCCVYKKFNATKGYVPDSPAKAMEHYAALVSNTKILLRAVGKDNLPESVRELIPGLNPHGLHERVRSTRTQLERGKPAMPAWF